jgi:putative aldouronate transport system permease protein
MVKKAKYRILTVDNIFMAFIYVFVTTVALAMLFPIVNILAISLSDYAEAVRHPAMIIPKGFNLKAYLY